MIRQEYITHLSQVSGITDIVRVPIRDELIESSSLQGVLTGVWSDAPYQYLYERHMSLLAAFVRDSFNNQQARTYTAPSGTETVPSGADQFNSLRLNSGWRNPERNEIVGGVSTSRHMVGRAMDIGAEDVLGYEDGTTSRAKLMWTLWNAAEGLPASQDGLKFRWLLERGTLGLVETGTTTKTNVPDTPPLIDERGAGINDPADGIPDVFNDATHLHAETKPSRSPVGWANE